MNMEEEVSLYIGDMISEFFLAVGFSKMLEMSQLCSQGKVEDFLSYLWKLEEAHEFLVPKIFQADKSEVDSETLRSKGNRFYKRNDINKALEYYNLSIMTAPCPSFTVSDFSQSKCDTENGASSGCREDKNSFSCTEAQSLYSGLQCAEGEFKTLALGYANRSAVLFELHQYEKCICDIELALGYGYPMKLQGKLQERKIKCFIALNKASAAREMIVVTLKGLDNLALDESKLKQTKKNLSLLYQKCLSKMDSKTNTSPDNIDFSRLATLKSSQLHFVSKTSKVPKLVETHPTFPALSSAIGVTYSRSEGTRLVAERDIHPGEVLLVEESFASVLHFDPSIVSTHCATCLLRCVTPHPCPNCTVVIFCSASCRLQGISCHHGQECKFLPTIVSCKYPTLMVLASRILTKVSYGQLKKWVPLLREEARNQNPRKRGLNGEGIYDSSDYRTVYHLLSGEKHKPEDDFFQMSLMVFIFTKLLEASKQFFIDDGVPFIPSEEDFILTAQLLLHHCWGLRRYVQNMTNVKVNVATQEFELLKVSLGIYPTGGLSKHSCLPVSAPTFFGNTMVLRAVAFIKAGEEVTQCHGPHFADMSKELREYIQRSRFNIICKCMACKNNWPMYKDISRKITQKCQKCSVPVHVKGRTCHKCKQAIPHVMRRLLNLMIIFYDTFKSREYECFLDITDEQRKVLYEMTELVNKYVLLPCQFYVDIQRALHILFSLDGSHFFVR